MKITTKKINLYGKDTDPLNGVKNAYDTSYFAFRQPCIHMIVGQRGQGKSHNCSKLISQAQKEKTFDSIYLISPSAKSNEAYFGKFIPDENIYKPTKDSVEKVIERVEEERDEFDEYLRKEKLYKEFLQILKSKREFSDGEIIKFQELGFLDDEFDRPKWKYDSVRPPQSLLILDDVLSSPAILQSSGIVKAFTLNRHISPLQEPHSGRSACGLAVILISQTYTMPQGVSRTLRENITHLLLFKNKQEKQMSKIREELGSAVDEDKFMTAYNMATKEKYGNLLVDFNPRCPTMTFRKNLNELIIFEDDKEQCNCG